MSGVAGSDNQFAVGDAEGQGLGGENYVNVVGITTADGAFQYYRASIDQAHQTWTLTTKRRKGWSSHLTYTQIRPGQILLRGTFGSHPLQATLTQMPDTKPPLLSRGFHWISPVPFNL